MTWIAPRRLPAVLTVLALFIPAPSSYRLARAADEVFSGPQPGEKLAPFKVQGVYDDAAGKELDFVSQAGGKPLVLAFVHEPVTRPQAALVRALSSYLASRSRDVASGVVWLQADKSKAEEFLKTARASLGLRTPAGISPDGLEGPGSYGLNRNVSLTVLVAKEGKVTANFALVQPAMADGPKIVAEVVKAAGGDPVTLEEFEKLAGARYAGQDAKQDPGAAQIPRELLAAVIRRDASDAEVAQAARAVEEYVGQAAARRQALGRVAHTIVSSGKLGNYGTPAAQKQIEEWAKRFKPEGR